MAIKDATVSWFIRNVLLPRNEIIDRPGFIVLKIGKKKAITNLREVVIPEGIFAELEKGIVTKHAEKGRQLLYSIGKRFGYRYASASHLPTIKESSEGDFLKFAYFVVRYIESIYSSKMTHEIDMARQLFTLSMNDYIVCSRNGIGHLLTEGSIAGIWAYVVQNMNIEGVQTKCQGRQDAFCEVVCAPRDYFAEKRMKCFSEGRLDNLSIRLPQYNNINCVRTSKFAKNSLKTIIDAGFIKYAHGTMTYKDERFLLLESSVMYLLEMGLKKLPGGLDLLWRTSFAWGKAFSGKFDKQDPCKFIKDLFPGFGFGDFFASAEGGKYKITVGFFPWNEWADEVEFVMFRAMLSGIISGMTGKKVELKKIRKSVFSDGFSLVIEE